MLNQSETVKQQIRSLLAVLALGVFCALTISFFFLYTYGPSGVYIVKNVMLSPSFIEKISFDSQTVSGKSERLHYDKTEFFYWQPEKMIWIKKPVTLEAYQKFFTQHEDEKSIAVSDKILASFQTPPAAKLISTVVNDDQSAPSKIFQEVHFAQSGGFYRVELIEQNSEISWAYFYSPNIYQSVQETFSGAKE